MKTRRNADEELRRLEREATAGDAHARHRWFAARARQGLPFQPLGRLHIKPKRWGSGPDGIAAARRMVPTGMPFRAPHYTASAQAMAQEVDLARGGVLLLDEASELSRRAWEAIYARLQYLGPEAPFVFVTTPITGRLPAWVLAFENSKTNPVPSMLPPIGHPMRGNPQHRAKRENYDPRLRELERQAATGDPRAFRRLRRAEEMAGKRKWKRGKFQLRWTGELGQPNLKPGKGWILYPEKVWAITQFGYAGETERGTRQLIHVPSGMAAMRLRKAEGEKVKDLEDILKSFGLELDAAAWELGGSWADERFVQAIIAKSGRGSYGWPHELGGQPGYEWVEQLYQRAAPIYARMQQRKNPQSELFAQNPWRPCLMPQIVSRSKKRYPSASSAWASVKRKYGLQKRDSKQKMHTKTHWRWKIGRAPRRPAAARAPRAPRAPMAARSPVAAWAPRAPVGAPGQATATRPPAIDDPWSWLYSDFAPPQTSGYMRQNPLMAVWGNPPTQAAEWVPLQEAQRYVNPQHLAAAAKRYETFHGVKPQGAHVVQIPDGKPGVTRKVVVALGHVPETHYVTQWDSNKEGYHWVHPHPEGDEPMEVLMSLVDWQEGEAPETEVTLKIPGSKTRVTDWWRD